MIDMIKLNETTPASWPDAPAGLSTAAAALDAAMIWQRIEAYTCLRFPEREVTFVLDGSGDWDPPYRSFAINASFLWAGKWTEIDLDFGPVGFILPGGMVRVEATIGGDEIPAAVSEAFRRLAEYLADDQGTAGASSTSVEIGPIKESLNRNPAWVARATQLSGAADLLRPYRRA